jgi:hypothetical protein
MSALAQLGNGKGGSDGSTVTLQATGRLSPSFTELVTRGQTRAFNSVTARRDGNISRNNPTQDRARVSVRGMRASSLTRGPTSARVRVATPRGRSGEFNSSLSRALRQYPTGYIAKGIGVTKGEVRRWKDESRQPSVPNLLELACLIPSVNALVMERIGKGMDTNDPRLLHDSQMARMRAMDGRK